MVTRLILAVSPEELAPGRLLMPMFVEYRFPGFDHNFMLLVNSEYHIFRNWVLNSACRRSQSPTKISVHVSGALYRSGIDFLHRIDPMYSLEHDNDGAGNLPHPCDKLATGGDGCVSSLQFTLTVEFNVVNKL